MARATGALVAFILLTVSLSGPVEASVGSLASELLAVTKTCRKAPPSRTYALDSGSRRTIPVCAGHATMYWTADFDVHCDGQVSKQCNGNTDPWFAPTTACHQSDGKPLKSAELPFIIVPLGLPKAGAVCGTLAIVIHGDRMVYGVVGDVGPRHVIGEGSYAMAEQLGIEADPYSGGLEAAEVTYIVFLGTRIDPIERPQDIGRIGDSHSWNLLQLRSAGPRGTPTPLR